MPQKVTLGNVVLRSGVTLMARVRGGDGALLTRAALSSVTYIVTSEVVTTTAADGTTTTTTTQSAVTLTISSVVFNSLQQADPRWTADSESEPGPDGEWGYNFAATLPATAFTEDGATYQVDVVFTPVTGQPWRCVFRFAPQDVYG